MKYSMHLNIRNGIECALRLIADYKINSLIDVGAGGTDHKFLFTMYGGGEVYTNDIKGKGQYNYPGDFMHIDFDRKFHIVYASNIIEHMKNTGMFIEKLFNICDDDGYVAIVVPRPHLNRLLSGHINIYTPVTLLYNIVTSGYDCSDARVCNGVYEKSIIVKKQPIRDKNFTYRTGVVDGVNTISKYFPWKVSHKCNALLPSVKWPTTYKLPKTGKFDEMSLAYLSGEVFTIQDGGSLSIEQENLDSVTVGII